MKRTVNKLVRDRIPELIRADGRECAVATMNASEFRAALMEKIIEEAAEVGSADDAHLVAEISDLLDVLDAIVIHCDLDWQALCEERQRRLTERGGFSRRTKLLWFESDEET
jgi:predicted house-cleaning noncanonical NTP pyrophosphatase (MazG superfamily)